MHNLPKTHPELFDYDNKTGLYSWKGTAQINSDILKRQANAGFIIPYS
jgi:hypothetical protein